MLAIVDLKENQNETKFERHYGLLNNTQHIVVMIIKAIK
jgi:hypothetical protein